LDIVKEKTFRDAYDLMRRYRQSVREHDKKLMAEKKETEKIRGQ
jgi:hypothetical protein